MSCHRGVLRVLIPMLAVGLYLALGFYQLELPGLQYDEAADAVPAIDMLGGQPPSCDGTIVFFGRQWPLMMRPHIGPTSTYLAFVAFALGGVSIGSLRVSQLLLGALTLVLYWTLARRWFGILTAALAVSMLATAPPFVWWSRGGINWTLPLLPLALGMLLALTLHWRTHRTRPLLLAAGLFGAGVTTKILFVWLVPALVLWALIVLGPTGLRREVARLGGGRMAGVVLAALGGLAPLLLYNLMTGGATLRHVAGNSRHTLYGHDNLDFVHNLNVVTRDFLRTMQGNTGQFPSPVGGGAGGLLLVVGLGVLIAECLHGRRRLRVPVGGGERAADDGLRARLFLVLAMVTILPLSTVSTSGIGATYLFILLPLAWLVVAVALRDVGRVLARWSPARLAAALALVTVVPAAFVVAQHVAANRTVHRYLAATGGTGFWSDAVVQLAAELKTEYRDHVPIAMDWGFERSVTFLTHGRVRMREAFEYATSPSASYDRTCWLLLSEPANLYVFHAPEETAFRGRFEVLAEVAARRGTKLRVIETLAQRDGRPNIVLVVADDEAGGPVER
jgi:hypothetical protein